VQGFGRSAYNLLFREMAWKVWGNPKTLSEELGRKRVPVPNVLEMLGSGKGKDSEGRELSAKHFFYPKYGGIGFISEKYAENLKKKKGKITLGAEIDSINTKGNSVMSVTYKKGKKKTVEKTDFLASTIYLKDMVSAIRPNAPKEVIEAASRLKYRSLILVFIVVNKPKVMKDNWVFFPERKYVFSRVSEHNSFSRFIVEDGKSILTAEIPCEHDSDMYTSEDDYVFRRVMDDLEETGILQESDVEEFLVKKSGRVYPVYDLDYRENLGKVLKYLDGFNNLITLGRQGLYNYNNTDHCIDMSLKGASYIDGTVNGRPVKNIQDWRETRRYFDAYRIVD
jgi:protoporphyrinogen oxidase